MAHLLEDQIDFLATRVDAIRPDDGVEAALLDLEAALSLSVEAFNLLRRRAGRACPPQAWTEAAARPFVPEYQRWYAVGQKLLALVRDFRCRGCRPEGTDAFMGVYMECKPIATAFDDLVASHQRWLRGDLSGYRPWTEIADELRAESGGAGGGGAA